MMMTGRTNPEIRPQPEATDSTSWEASIPSAKPGTYPRDARLPIRNGCRSSRADGPSSRCGGPDRGACRRVGRHPLSAPLHPPLRIPRRLRRLPTGLNAIHQARAGSFRRAAGRYRRCMPCPERNRSLHRPAGILGRPDLDEGQTAANSPIRLLRQGEWQGEPEDACRPAGGRARVRPSRGAWRGGRAAELQPGVSLGRGSHGHATRGRAAGQDQRQAVLPVRIRLAPARSSGASPRQARASRRRLARRERSPSITRWSSRCSCGVVRSIASNRR